MKSFILYFAVFSLVFTSSIFAQPVKRLLGSQGFDLDDNSHHHIFITDNNGGLGIDSAGNVTLGFPNSCSILDISSTTHGILIPRLTTAQEMGVCGGTPPEGMLMYNTTTHTFDVYNGSSWGGSWVTTGNSGNTIDNANNLLGSTATSPVKPINIVVGGNRIVRYETNNRIMGGFTGNSISGGSSNGVISGGGSAGSVNTITGGNYSTISGGGNNMILGNYSAITGGAGLTLGSNSFGYNTSDAIADPSANSNIAYFGNVNLWLGNTDGTVQQLRFYDPNNNTTYTGSLFSAFQASAGITGTTQYALPADYGTGVAPNVPPYVLADVTAAGTPRQLSWQSVNSLGWSLGGNSGTSPVTNFLGTTDNNDFVIRTNSNIRSTFAGTPTALIPLVTFQNTTPGIQGVRINGSIDAVSGNTLAANPGVWDLVVDGDEVVTGVLKTGGSLWFDGNSSTHSITADKPLTISTTSNDSLMFGTNGSTKMTIAANGFVGIGTMNPLSPLHIVGAPPDPIHKDAIPYFYLPDPVNHVLTVENTMSNGKGNGIAIIIHNPSSSDKVTDGQYNNEASNYLTFYNDVGDRNHIRGRVESFSYQNFNDMVAAIANVYNTYVLSGDIYNPLNYFTCNLGFDSHFMDNAFNSHFMDNSFNSGFLNNVFTLPTLPTFSSGSFPSISFSDFQFTVVTPDAFPNINVDLGNILPSLSGGSLPSLTGGSVGSICFGCIQSPINFSAITSPINFSSITTPITNLTNPFSVNYSFIDGILNSIAAIPYKQKVIDILSSGPKVAAIKAAATYAAAFFSGGVTYESGSGDYAEWLERADHNEKISLGDVLGVVGGKISKNTEGAQQLMVASFKPCVLGNMPQEGKEQFFNKVAFMGQVPVKMISGVRVGDYIVPDGHNQGFARAISPENITPEDLDKVLGVSWQDAPEVGIKFVNIAVGLKPHEVVKVIQDQQKQLDELKADVAEIRSEMHSAHTTKYSKKKTRNTKQLTSK